MYKVRTQEIEVIVKQLESNNKLFKQLNDGSLVEPVVDKINNIVDKNDKMIKGLKETYNV